MSHPCIYRTSGKRNPWGRDRSPESVRFEAHIRSGVDAQVRHRREIPCASCRTPTPIAALRGAPQRWVCPACFTEETSMPKVLPPPTAEKIRTLLEQGLSITTVAKEAGVARATVQRFKARHAADLATAPTPSEEAPATQGETAEALPSEEDRPMGRDDVEARPHISTEVAALREARAADQEEIARLRRMVDLAKDAWTAAREVAFWTEQVSDAEHNLRRVKEEAAAARDHLRDVERAIGEVE